MQQSKNVEQLKEYAQSLGFKSILIDPTTKRLIGLMEHFKETPILLRDMEILTHTGHTMPLSSVNILDLRRDLMFIEGIQRRNLEHAFGKEAIEMSIATIKVVIKDYELNAGTPDQKIVQTQEALDEVIQQKAVLQATLDKTKKIFDLAVQAEALLHVELAKLKNEPKG